MLYEEETAAAIVVGFQLKFEEWSVPLETVEALKRAVEGLEGECQTGMRFLAPGDTTDTGVGEASNAVLGRILVLSENYENPREFEVEKLEEALAEAVEIPESYWDALREAVPDFAGPAQEEAALLMLSWGPLSYGAVYIGVAMNQSEREEATYGFVANQDMGQEWTEGGLDGIHVAGVEFDDVRELDFSEEAQEEHREQVLELGSASYFLVCRYD